MKIYQVKGFKQVHNSTPHWQLCPDCEATIPPGHLHQCGYISIPVTEVSEDGCKKSADWVLYSQEPGMETMSCAAHLIAMIDDDTAQIVRTNKAVPCCFVEICDIEVR